MKSPRTRLARAALLANGMVWFGLSFMMFAVAAEQTYTAFTGTVGNIVGWSLLLAVAVGLAVVGVIENRNIRSGKKRHARS